MNNEREPAPFGLVAVTGKFMIGSLDNPNDPAYQVTAQFNPTTLTIDRTVGWGDPGEAGGSNSATKSGIEKQFQGAKGRGFTIELLFDDVDTKRTVDPNGRGGLVKNIEKLEKLASVRVPKSKEENQRRPHWCVATWGSMLQDKEAATGFRCVIETIQTKYELFSPDGTPLRARVTLKLVEASSVSLDKKLRNKPPSANRPAGAPSSTPTTGSGGGTSGTGGTTPPAGGGTT
jgi:Contractile injection system tube protein